MTGTQRREQLILVGRHVFAERGVGNATVEQIASEAGVTKPVVYEHFGGKEGLYQVVVDREIQTLVDTVASTLTSGVQGRPLLTRAALAMLTYVEERPDGFRVLSHDSPAWHGTGRIGSLLSDIGERVELILADDFTKSGLDPRFASIYSQMLVGMVAYTADWWLEHEPDLTKEELAAHLSNFAWNGLERLHGRPELRLDAEDTDEVAGSPS
ncbi:TetR/AcrR family transcriptional regulator [Demetria terragena]|uniref:TetR/AcrR family transcriptional regulator n=1 Tax=Demetria terragena TaxID=63959 RepID=UPI00037B77DF|nr:TetR/AcrR family transcriptional regulator [Demetria terragena]